MFGLNNQFLEEKEQLEQSIILRLPENIDEKNESICIIPYKDEKDPSWFGRTFILNYENSIYYGLLYDLPFIVESQKTFDNLSYYKTGDISQILIFNPYPNETLAYPDSYIYVDGLTPVTKNANRLFDTSTMDKDSVYQAQFEIFNIMEGKKCTNEFQVVSIPNPDYQAATTAITATVTVHQNIPDFPKPMFSPQSTSTMPKTSFTANTSNSMGIMSPQLLDPIDKPIYSTNIEDKEDGWNEQSETYYAKRASLVKGSKISESDDMQVDNQLPSLFIKTGGKYGGKTGGKTGRQEVIATAIEVVEETPVESEKVKLLRDKVKEKNNELVAARNTKNMIKIKLAEKALEAVEKELQAELASNNT